MISDSVFDELIKSFINKTNEKIFRFLTLKLFITCYTIKTF